jgi:glutamate 5-kinase
VAVNNFKNSNLRQRLKNAKRIVVKVGTSTLTYDTGKINLSRIDKLSMVLSDLVNQGKEVILVTSVEGRSSPP